AELARYVDILTLFPPEDFAAHRALSDKQREVGEFESRVVDAIKRELGLGEVGVLHPSVLFEAYFRFLKLDQLAYARSVMHDADGTAEGLTSIYEPMDAPALGDLAGVLPDDYVAVRFYSSIPFPDIPESREFASAVIESLSRRTDVVLLSHPFELD